MKTRGKNISVPHILHLPFSCSIAELFMTLILFILVYTLSHRAAALASENPANLSVFSSFINEALMSNPSTKPPVVVLDSGHGGHDPGKIGVNGALEKDINLQIASKLKLYLEASDVQVIMTRDTDASLCSPDDKNKKIADMRNRCRLIDEVSPDLVVSIHQNSYHEESVQGGQVFYYKGSTNGKQLAQILQDRFDFVLGADNHRQPKANDSYYLLLHIKQPAVIVECGFLSNDQEADLLSTDEYQDRLAWTIHMGIMEYLNSRPQVS